MSEVAVDNETASQYLTFKLGSEVYALEVNNAREILEYSAITPIPQMPAWICGVINLRGSVVPVIDLNAKLGMSVQPRTVNTCIIVVEIRLENELFVVGALVDAVQEVFEMDREQIEPPPEFGTRLSTDFMKGMGKRNDLLFIILDAERIFASKEIALAGRAGLVEHQVVGQAVPATVATAQQS